MGNFVVIADDDPFNLDLLQEVCVEEGHRVAVASDGAQVLDIVARERPDLVLLDLAMPVMNGFEVLKVFKSDPDLATIPVIVVTASGDVASRREGLELGATDYVTKPYRLFEIRQRIRVALRLEVADVTVRRVSERLRQLETVDPLTRVGTSKQLWVTASYEFSRAARYKHSLTAMVVNLRGLRDAALPREKFEECLVELAKGLRTCVRTIDHVFRTDEDQFMLLLPETHGDGAECVKQRIVERTSGSALFSAPSPAGLLVQVTYATVPASHIHSHEELLRAARG